MLHAARSSRKIDAKILKAAFIYNDIWATRGMLSSTSVNYNKYNKTERNGGFKGIVTAGSEDREEREIFGGIRNPTRSDPILTDDVISWACFDVS